MIGTGDPGFRRDLLEALLQSLPPEIGKSGRAAQERKEIGHGLSEKKGGRKIRVKTRRRKDYTRSPLPTTPTCNKVSPSQSKFRALWQDRAKKDCMKAEECSRALPSVSGEERSARKGEKSFALTLQFRWEE
jgi:hypothetical protein